VPRKLLCHGRLRRRSAPANSRKNLAGAREDSTQLPNTTARLTALASGEAQGRQGRAQGTGEKTSVFTTPNSRAPIHVALLSSPGLGRMGNLHRRGEQWHRVLPQPALSN